MTEPLASFENPRYRGSRPRDFGAMGRVGFGGVSPQLETAMVGVNNDVVMIARRPGDVPVTPSVQLDDPGYWSAVRRFVKDGTVSSVLISPSSGTDFVISSREGGESQNGITIELIDPGRANRPLRVFVDAQRVRVWLATDGSAAITTTAADMVAAINTDMVAAEVVIAGIAEASAGVLAAVARTNLSGGADDAGLTQVLLDTDGAGTITTTGNQLVTTLQSANFGAENAAANDGTGTVTALARTELGSGKDPLGVKSQAAENCVNVEDYSSKGSYHMNEMQKGLQPTKMTTRSDAIRRVKENERDITRGKVNQEVQHESVGRVV